MNDLDPYAEAFQSAIVPEISMGADGIRHSISFVPGRGMPVPPLAGGDFTGELAGSAKFDAERL